MMTRNVTMKAQTLVTLILLVKHAFPFLAVTKQRGIGIGMIEVLDNLTDLADLVEQLFLFAVGCKASEFHLVFWHGNNPVPPFQPVDTLPRGYRVDPGREGLLRVIVSDALPHADEGFLYDGQGLYEPELAMLDKLGMIAAARHSSVIREDIP